MVERLLRSIYKLSRDDQGRFYSNISLLKRDLRSHLRYAGNPLVYLDIKNCMPFLLTRLRQPGFWQEDGGDPAGLLTYGMLYESHLPVRKIELSCPIEEMKERVIGLRGSSDIGRYIEIVTAGRIYEELMVVLNECDRDTVKEIYMKILNSEDKRKYDPRGYRPKQVFKSLFPNVYQVQQWVREVNYVYLSHLLMRVESYCVIDVICQRISKEKPRVPIFTIHDGILTPKGNEAYVFQVMEEELERLIGFRPIIIEVLKGTN